MPWIRKLPGLVQSGKVNLDRYEENAPLDDKPTKLEREPVESEETDLDEVEGLAGHIIVYLHDKIPDLFDYSRNALVGLDSYFERNPMSTAFKHRFVERELVPALGAYFGEVLVRQLGGRWLKSKPIGLPAVAVMGHVIIPLRIAIDMASSRLSLASVFDTIQAERH